MTLNRHRVGEIAQADRGVRSSYPPAHEGGHLVVLDGWRSLSILLVLFGHLAPLNYSVFQLNATIAASGMVIFFTLSGFLITLSLINGIGLKDFFIRRTFRIIPLAWISMTLLLAVGSYNLEFWWANLLFYSNLPPQRLLNGGGHFWSLCVEMQLYAVLALATFAFRKYVNILIPALALLVTMLRVNGDRYADIVTWFRCDEILAGGILALIYTGHYSDTIRRLLHQLNPFYILPLLVASAHSEFGALNYIRPYISFIMVGASLYNAPAVMIKISKLSSVRYVARISYALYVVHGMLMSSWLGDGGKLIKYLKRPILIAITFIVSHYSTFRFEEPINRLAKRLTNRNTKTTPHFAE